MADIKFNGSLPNETLENKIKQGDFIFCKSTHGGTGDFWGIYGHDCGVVCLDGAGNHYIPKNDLYLGGCYSYWQIVYRISCDDALVEIKEVSNESL